MISITQQQYKRLRRLKRLVKNVDYEFKLTLIHATMLMPGLLQVTTRKAERYDRFLKLLKGIIPAVNFEYEHGFGWHYLDRTEYHHGYTTFRVQDK